MTGAPTTTTLLLDDIPVDEAAPHRGSIARITIDRPAKLNALNQQVWSDMRTLIDHVEAEDHYRVIVIAGAPPPEPEEGKRRKPHAFAAGADISEFVGKDSSAIWSIFNDRNIWEVVWEASKPTLAMVDGQWPMRNRLLTETVVPFVCVTLPGRGPPGPFSPTENELAVTFAPSRINVVLSAGIRERTRTTPTLSVPVNVCVPEVLLLRSSRPPPP